LNVEGDQVTSRKRLVFAAVLAITITAIASTSASAADAIEFVAQWWRGKL
jgi:hypothetical protein